MRNRRDLLAEIVKIIESEDAQTACVILGKSSGEKYKYGHLYKIVQYDYDLQKSLIDLVVRFCTAQDISMALRTGDIIPELQDSPVAKIMSSGQTHLFYQTLSCGKIRSDLQGGLVLKVKETGCIVQACSILATGNLMEDLQRELASFIKNGNPERLHSHEIANIWEAQNVMPSIKCELIEFLSLDESLRLVYGSKKESSNKDYSLAIDLNLLESNCKEAKRDLTIMALNDILCQHISDLLYKDSTQMVKINEDFIKDVYPMVDIEDLRALQDNPKGQSTGCNTL